MAEVQLPPQPPHKKMSALHSPNVDADVMNNEEVDEYSTYKRLQRELEYIQLQEEYIKDEQRYSSVNTEPGIPARLTRSQESEERTSPSTGRNQEDTKCAVSDWTVHGGYRSEVGNSSRFERHQLIRVNSTGIVQSSTGSNYVVRILSTLDREKLKPSSSVALHRHSNALVDILPPEADSSIAMLGTDEKPDVTYADVGGLDMQKQEIREAVELPLTQFDLYKQIGQYEDVDY